MSLFLSLSLYIAKEIKRFKFPLLSFHNIVFQLIFAFVGVVVNELGSATFRQKQEMIKLLLRKIAIYSKVKSKQL